MIERYYTLIAGVVFLLIALGHLLRVAIGATFVVEGVAIPMWASLLAVLFMGYLGYEGLRIGRKHP